VAEEIAAEKIIHLIIDSQQFGGPPDPPDDGGGDDCQPAPVEFSDDAVAAELSKDSGGDWRCAQPAGQWYRWDQRRWARDHLKRIFREARRICRRVGLRAASSQMKSALEIARKMSSRERIYAATVLASTEKRHATELKDFDAHPWLLNTPAGIIDLKTGQLLPHDPAWLLSQITTAAPEGECPRFRQYLREVTGNNVDYGRYLLRVGGYCLTGSCEEQQFFFLFGPSHTGKSLFLEILRLVLGPEFAASADMDVFVVHVGERHPTELADFHKRRVIVVFETEEDRRFNESRLKTLTGNDPINAHFMRQDGFTFTPTHKLLFSGNHLPRLRSADDAMRNRCNILPFVHKHKENDTKLPEKLMPELGDILKLFVEGALEWQRIGLKPPPVVVKATDEYFERENRLGRWIDERCERDVNLTCYTRDIYPNYRSWAAAIGEFILSERLFSEKLAQFGGIERWRDEHGRGFSGIALRRGAQARLDLESAEDGWWAGGKIVHPPQRPGEPVHDPAEEWPRD
jgi:putative DNA primase/helicase